MKRFKRLVPSAVPYLLIAGLAVGGIGYGVFFTQPPDADRPVKEFREVGTTDSIESVADQLNKEFRKAGSSYVFEDAADPTVNDDRNGTAGNGLFYKFDQWYNTTDGSVWVCVDSSATAAVWVDITTRVDVTIGTGGIGVDYRLTFDGEDSDGYFEWDEDLATFAYNDKLLIEDSDATYGQRFSVTGDFSLATESKSPADVHCDVNTYGTKLLNNFTSTIDLNANTGTQSGKVRSFTGNVRVVGTGDVSYGRAFDGELWVSSTATLEYAYGYYSQLWIDNGVAGEITNAYEYYAFGVDAEDGTVAVAANFYGAPHKKDGGTLTTAYGIRLDQQTAGGTNWQIYSFAGDSFFGRDDSKTFWGTSSDAAEFYDGDDFYVDISGATAGTGTPDVICKLQEAAGASHFIVTDNADVPVTSIDSDGNLWSVSSIIRSTASGGGLTRTYSEAVVTLAGASTDIQVNVPTGSLLLGCQLRVDTLITSGDGAVTWSAAYVGGSAQVIGPAGQAFAKNTKVNAFFDANAATAIAAGEVDVRISANANTFNGGVVRAIVFYEYFEALDDAP